MILMLSWVTFRPPSQESPMNPITVVRLPFTRHAGWKELQRRRPSIPLLAALAPLPLWSSALVLVIPSLLLNALAVLVALGISISLVYHGLQALCQRQDEDVETMAATYTIMAAGVLAWGLLMAIIWAY